MSKVKLMHAYVCRLYIIVCTLFMMITKMLPSLSQVLPKVIMQLLVAIAIKSFIIASISHLS